MMRTVRTLVVLVAIVGLAGLAPADAAPRATVASPWVKTDQVGEAARPQGDIRGIVVENGRQNIRLTFRTVAKPIWDTTSNSLRTFMAFKLDWQGTALAHDRRITVSFSEGTWYQVIYLGNGNTICFATGGVTVLPNFGYRITVPVNSGCMGGARVIRVAGEFWDDFDASAGEDIRKDRVPNGGGYGPFIRLPN